MEPDIDVRTNDEEIKILLKRNLALTEENNKMLKSIRSTARFHTILRLIYILIIIGALFWSYHLFQPYFDQIKGTYNSYQETQSKFQEMLNNFLPGKSQ